MPLLYTLNHQQMVQQTMDFMLAYPHAPAEVPLYMHFPKGYIFKNGVTKEKHILKLTKNIYGQKQAGRIWNKFLDNGFGEIGFKPSKIDPCLYYQDKVVILIYINDCIMFSPEKSALNQVIKDMHDLPRKFRIKDLGDIKEFLGIQVYCKDDGSITLTQPQLIDSILHDLNFQDNTKGKETPALSTVILQKDAMGKSFNNNY